MSQIIDPIITIGNVITIVIFLLGFTIQAIIFTNMVSKFMAQSVMDRLNLHKDIEAAKESCRVCYTKDKIEILEKDKDRMDKEQITLRAQLPLKLDEIWKEIKAIRQILEQRRYESGDRGETGDRGYRGDRGEIGPQGVQGLPGKDK